MFCPGRQIDAGCFVRGVKKWHGMFCPGMFCPTFADNRMTTVSHLCINTGACKLANAL